MFAVPAPGSSTRADAGPTHQPDGAGGRPSLLAESARDLRHAWRAIRRMPATSVVIVASLAVGIGANLAVFSWIQAVALRPLPGVENPDRFEVVQVETVDGHVAGTSWREYEDVRERMRGFASLIAYRMVPLTLGDREDTGRAYGMLVSGNYFAALGLRPAAGRFPGVDDVTLAEPVAVISWDLWRRRFGRAPEAIGQRLLVNDRELTIIGVTPRGFQGTVLGLTFDMWLPATIAPTILAGTREIEDRGVRAYSLIATLAPRTTRTVAQRELDGVMQRLAAEHPGTNAGIGAKVLAFWDAPRGPQRLFVGALAVLQGLMLVVLLAVCGNIANLVRARAGTRRREMGVRLALGSGRSRIVALVLVENTLLAAFGAVAGTVLAVWLTRALAAVPITGLLPVRFQVGVDAAGLGIASALALLCGVTVGLAPALQLARVDASGILRAGSDIAGRSRLRNILMGIEVALAVIVLLVAALFLRRFADTRVTETGFRREGVLLAAYDLTGRFTDPATPRIVAADLLDRLGTLPGVDAVAIAAAVPLDIHGLPLRPFTLEGRPRTDGIVDVAVMNVVTPGYFETMGIPLRAGRDFTALRDQSSAPEAIVNEEFVRRFLSDATVLGHRLETGTRTFTIVGVVRNSLYDSFGEAPKPIIHFSYRDRPAAMGQIHLRTKPGTELLLAPDVRRVVREVRATVPVYDVRTLEDHVERNLFLRRIPARIFSVLGPMLLALAAIGIYAVVSYTVSQRRNEIGLRLALGGSPQRVIVQILEDSAGAIMVGALAGWIIAFTIVRQLAGGDALDVSVFAGVPVALLAVAAVACWLPARRATRIDPVAALRQE